MAPHSHKYSLLGLPIEVLTMVFGSVPSPKELRGVFLSCKHLRDVVLANQHAISYLMLRSTFSDEHLSIAVARDAAERATWRQLLNPNFLKDMAEGYEKKIVDFCEEYIGQPGATPLPLQKDVTLDMANRLVRFRGTASMIADFYGLSFGGCSRQINAGVDQFLSGRDAKYDPALDMPMSQTERWRVEKVLYIIEMVRFLFPIAPHGKTRPEQIESGDNDMAFIRFWQYFAPWENEQASTIMQWFTYSVKSVLKSRFFSRTVYSRRSHDRSSSIVFLIGINGMLPILLSENVDLSLYQKIIKDYECPLVNEDYRRRISTRDRAYFNHPNHLGSKWVRLNELNYYKKFEVAGEENGPRDVWMYNLSWHHERVFWGRLRKYLRFDKVGAVEMKMAMFWDRSRLDRRFTKPTRFPTYKQMLRESERNEILLSDDICKTDAHDYVFLNHVTNHIVVSV
ncbi:hypothetical protein F4809DRAFT_664517 [Biscogniauxia mediterranea]|nr:hypothetical protein F4809DRAFT_664517 [Biscogniauxia mediterranea]